MKLNDLKIDAAKAEAGDWVGDIPDLGDLRLKVRGIANSDARRLRNKLVATLARALRTEPLEQDKITARILAETVLLGWENFDQTYSKERAFEILSDPDYEPFRDGVVWASTMVAECQTANMGDDAKNSPTSLSGSSIGAKQQRKSEPQQ